MMKMIQQNFLKSNEDDEDDEDDTTKLFKIE